MRGLYPANDKCGLDKKIVTYLEFLLFFKMNRKYILNFFGLFCFFEKYIN